MHVSDAIAARKSIRAFLDTPVSTPLLEQLLLGAARAPSGGNVQPWRIYVVNGPAMVRFHEHLNEPASNESPAYEIYPQGLTEPYRSSRFKVGEDMYQLLGISRDDRPARIRRLMENYRFFGAPAAIFCFIDKQMGPPQWSDLGMFLQSFMLLATEAGLGTCAQEAWATKAETVARFVQSPAEQMLFCGVAIGYTDEQAAVNSLVSDREPLANFTTFLD
jgi:nitroreductase